MCACVCTLYTQTQIYYLLLVASTAPGHGVLHDALPPHPQNGEEVRRLASRGESHPDGEEPPLPDGMRL